MTILGKVEITIDFNGKFGHLWVRLLIYCKVNVTETFRNVLKHYFLKTKVVKFAKCML